MKFSAKHLQQLKAQKKIKGFKADTKEKAIKVPQSGPGKHLLNLEVLLRQFCTEHQLTLIVDDGKLATRFYPGRKWRFDFIIRELRIAVEYEGGILNPNGDHRSVKGIMRDIEKYNAATAAGWRVFRCTGVGYSNIIKTLTDACIIDN